MLNAIKKLDAVLAGVVVATATWVAFTALALASLAPLSRLPRAAPQAHQGSTAIAGPALEVRR